MDDLLSTLFTLIPLAIVIGVRILAARRKREQRDNKSRLEQLLNQMAQTQAPRPPSPFQGSSSSQQLSGGTPASAGADSFSAFDLEVDEDAEAVLSVAASVSSPLAESYSPDRPWLAELVDASPPEKDLLPENASLDQGQRILDERAAIEDALIDLANRQLNEIPQAPASAYENRLAQSAIAAAGSGVPANNFLARLEALSPLRRAVVMAEVLGQPKAL